jgi:hypothetical protein
VLEGEEGAFSWSANNDLVRLVTIPTTKKPIKVNPINEMMGVAQSEEVTASTGVRNSKEA